MTDFFLIILALALIAWFLPEKEEKIPKQSCYYCHRLRDVYGGFCDDCVELFQ